MANDRETERRLNVAEAAAAFTLLLDSVTTEWKRGEGIRTDYEQVARCSDVMDEAAARAAELEAEQDD